MSNRHLHIRWTSWKQVILQQFNISLKEATLIFWMGKPALVVCSNPCPLGISLQALEAHRKTNCLVEIITEAEVRVNNSYPIPICSQTPYLHSHSDWNINLPMHV